MTPEQELRGLLPPLDASIEREILRLRGRYQLSLDEFRGLYVSDAQIDALLRSAGMDPAGSAYPLFPRPASAPRFDSLVSRFGLDSTERALLLLAVAVELDTRYATLFAYLNDDAARRLPTPDLAMRLIDDDGGKRYDVRVCLMPGSKLRVSGAIMSRDEGSGALQAGFSAAPAIMLYLLGGDVLCAAGLTLVSATESNDSDAAAADAIAAVAHRAEPRPIAIFAGRDGTGRRIFAAGVAARMGRPLAQFDLARQGVDVVNTVLLAARIEDVALVLVARELPDAAILARLKATDIPLFLAVHDAGPWERALISQPKLVRRFAVASLVERDKLWRTALRSEDVRAPAAAVQAVAVRFRLSDGAIRRAARDVRLIALAPTEVPMKATTEQLVAAARRQCAIDLGDLATWVDARPGWDDLVLPVGTQEQLRDFAGAAMQRDRVFSQWGMRDVGRGVGGGVAALFAGASGTGKTMSAAVVARATGLDLWRIDLSTVVSKYIGETEKNLDRIFNGARDGDAILFFDEADALFGKRSEVKDAHDRYANIEVAYLLQRLEEHDGIAILASNFSRNIDLAFVRRLNYIIEFPLPDARLRERLWRKAFARETPLGEGIDFAFLGRQFALTGGDIRSAALDAAFLAASDGRRVTMPHIVRAVSRQMLKQGQLPNRGDFGGWLDAVPPELRVAE